MEILLVVKLGSQQGLSLEGSDSGETLQRGGELGEYWRFGDSLESLDISGGGHVESPQSYKDHSQHQRGQNYPGTDQEYHSQNTSDVETDLKGGRELTRIIINFHIKLLPIELQKMRPVTVHPLSPYLLKICSKSDLEMISKYLKGTPEHKSYQLDLCRRTCRAL